MTSTSRRRYANRPNVFPPPAPRSGRLIRRPYPVRKFPQPAKRVPPYSSERSLPGPIFTCVRQSPCRGDKQKVGFRPPHNSPAKTGAAPRSVYAASMAKTTEVLIPKRSPDNLDAAAWRGVPAARYSASPLPLRMRLNNCELSALSASDHPGSPFGLRPRLRLRATTRASAHVLASRVPRPAVLSRNHPRHRRLGNIRRGRIFSK